MALLDSSSPLHTLVGTSMHGFSGKYYRSKSTVSTIFPLLFTSPCFHPSWAASRKMFLQYPYYQPSPFDDYFLLLEFISNGGVIYNIDHPYVYYNDITTSNRLSSRHSGRRVLLFSLVRVFVFLLFLQKYFSPNSSPQLILSIIKRLLYLQIPSTFLSLLSPLVLFANFCNVILFRLYSFSTRQ